MPCDHPVALSHSGADPPNVRAAPSAGKNNLIAVAARIWIVLLMCPNGALVADNIVDANCRREVVVEPSHGRVL